jgi:hypothetical protein
METHALLILHKENMKGLRIRIASEQGGFHKQTSFLFRVAIVSGTIDEFNQYHHAEAKVVELHLTGDALQC